MPSPPLLVFDLDGTMVDTAGDLIAALNETMAEIGLAAIPISEVGNLVGAGGRALIEWGLRFHGHRPVDHDIDALQARFVGHYGRLMPANSQPYPGLIAALDQFEAAGWHFAVCTNKTEALARQLLEALGLASRLRAICGGDTFPVRKPDAGHILGTITRAGGDRTRAIMVGDSRADIDAAKNAGVPVVAVSFGYTDIPVRELSPDVVIDHFDDLWGAVEMLRP